MSNAYFIAVSRLGTYGSPYLRARSTKIDRLPDISCPWHGGGVQRDGRSACAHGVTGSRHGSVMVGADEQSPLTGGSDDMSAELNARARQVMALAEEAARANNHDYVGTEHILLGLL